MLKIKDAFRGFKLLFITALFLLVDLSLSAQPYSVKAKGFADELSLSDVNKLTILDMSFEGGNVYLQNLDDPTKTHRITMGKAGGMGTVVPPTAEAIYTRAKQKGINVSMNMVSPYLSKPMSEHSLEKLIAEGYITKVRTISVVVDGSVYKVEAYVGKTTYGGNQYLLSCPDLWDNYLGSDNNPFHRTSQGKRESDRLSKGYETLHGNPNDLVDLRAYVGFSQASAELYEVIGANVSIINDFHPALALFYTDMPALFIGHNMAFHGILPINNKEAPYWDHEGAKRYLAKFTNLDPEIIEKYFRIWNSSNNIGAASIVKAAIVKLMETTGVGIVTVSEPYAEELKMDYFQTRDRIIARNKDRLLNAEHFNDDRSIERIVDFYHSLGLLDFNSGNARNYLVKEESRGLDNIRESNIVGIVNGLDQNLNPSVDVKLQDIVKNPYNNKFFNDATKQYLAKIAKDPYFKNGLNYSSKDPKRFFRTQKVLRKMLLMEFFPNNPEVWDNTESYIVYNFGRLTDQKGVELLYSNVDNITANGDIVIIVGTEPKGIYGDMANIMKAKATEMQSKGKYFAFTSSFTPYYYVYGADLKAAPSLFEPCGVTPPEGNRGGVPALVSDAGGLQSLKDAFFFNMIQSDPKASAENLLKAYYKARREWSDNRDLYDQRRLRVSEIDYSYDVPSELFLELLTLARMKEIFNTAVEVAEAYAQGKAEYKDYKVVKDAVMTLPDWVREAFKKYATRFSSYEEKKAYFFGVSNSTIEGLFSADGDVTPLVAKEDVARPSVVEPEMEKLTPFEQKAFGFIGNGDYLKELITEGKGSKREILITLCLGQVNQLRDSGLSLEQIIANNLDFFASADGFISEYIKSVKGLTNVEDRKARMTSANLWLVKLSGALELLEGKDALFGAERVAVLNSEFEKTNLWMEMPREVMLKDYIKDYHLKTRGVEIRSAKMNELTDLALMYAVEDPGQNSEILAIWMKMVYGTEAERGQDGLLYYVTYRADKVSNPEQKFNSQYQILNISFNSLAILDSRVDLVSQESRLRISTSLDRLLDVSKDLRERLETDKTDRYSVEFKEKMNEELKRYEERIRDVRERSKVF